MYRVILDTDLAMGAPGSDIDDGFALALAHADPEIQLDLVTTVNGNTDVESATVLSLELLRRLAVGDVPVVKGAAAPLLHPERRRTPPAEVTERSGHGLSPAPGYAAAAIAEHVAAHPGEITVVAIGPLTNIATALALEPRLPDLVREIVIMGGVFLGPTGHRDMAGEFNVWSDPEAAAAVLRSGAPQRWVGLDVTLQVRLTTRHAEQLQAGSGAFSRLAGESTLAWIEHCRNANPGDPREADSCAMHDPLAVAAVTHPELLTWADVSLDVLTGDGPGRGMMITDLRRSAEPPAANARIAVGVDADGFTELFLRSIAGL